MTRLYQKRTKSGRWSLSWTWRTITISRGQPSCFSEITSRARSSWVSQDTTFWVTRTCLLRSRKPRSANSILWTGTMDRGGLQCRTPRTTRFSWLKTPAYSCSTIKTNLCCKSNLTLAMRIWKTKQFATTKGSFTCWEGTAQKRRSINGLAPGTTSSLRSGSK